MVSFADGQTAFYSAAFSMPRSPKRMRCLRRMRLTGRQYSDARANSIHDGLFGATMRLSAPAQRISLRHAVARPVYAGVLSGTDLTQAIRYLRPMKPKSTKAEQKITESVTN